MDMAPAQFPDYEVPATTSVYKLLVRWLVDRSCAGVMFGISRRLQAAAGLVSGTADCLDCAFLSPTHR